MVAGSVIYGRESIDFNVLHVVRKTLAIEVRPDGGVVIKAPIGTSLAEIQQMVGKRARWINEQQRYFRQFEPRTPERQYIGGETHLYLGRQYRLKICQGSRDSVKLAKGFFQVESKGAPNPDTIRALLDKWYVDKAISTFHNSVELCWPNFAKLGLPRPRLQTRKMKKRWGSLSKGGLLTLNPALIRAPRECIDYVITHELCHLQSHDHGPRFYGLLERMMPDWQKRKHKLELALV